ncbi:MAG: xanthine dehydrogenase family protein subunit M [Anaerolineae bacterium]|jgi:carbon-monoxide dehydrogenase medium subunit
MLARPGLPRFDYVRPDTFLEAVSLLKECEETALPLLGGTDLFPKMRDGTIAPDVLVDVKHLPGMRDIAYDEDTGLTIGAAATMNQIARDVRVRAYYPLLAQAAGTVGSYQLRNRATIGGNLCNASPCADGALATVVLDGRVVLFGPEEAGDSERGPRREMPAAEFFTGPGETALKPGEFVIAIRFSPLAARAASRHLKLSRNKLGDLALVSVGVLGSASDGGPRGDRSAGADVRFRVGLGAVAPTVVRATAAEAILADRPPGREAFALAAEKAAEAAAPIDDVRAGAAYRRAMVRNLTLRGLESVWGQLHEALMEDRGGAT